MTSNEYIYGRRPAVEALNSDLPIDRIVLRMVTGGKIIGDIIESAKKHDVRIDRLPATIFDKKFNPKASGGVVVFLSSIKTLTIDELLSKINARQGKPFIVILDGIEDPHNLGAIARSAEGAGCNGIVIPQRRCAPLNAIAVKISAGALLHLPVAKVVNFASVIQVLKQFGVWIFGADVEGKDYQSINYPSTIALVIGAEGKGISPLIKSKCDELISIPLKGKVASLNASVSAGILLFHITKFMK